MRTFRQPPYKDIAACQIWAEILEKPMSRDLGSGDLFVLGRSKDSQIEFFPHHHFDPAGDTEIFNGYAAAFSVNPKLLNPQCFPNPIQSVVFVEIEPGIANQNFQRLCDQPKNEQNLTILSACFISYIGKTHYDWDKEKLSTPARAAVCYIEVNPTQIPFYRLVLPPVIFGKGTDLIKIYQDWKNLPFKIPATNNGAN